jgi:hypothetical protein
MIKHLEVEELAFLKPEIYYNLTRFGSVLDGGYVLPYNSVVEADFLLSGGVSLNSDFENALTIINSNLQVVLVDGRISIIKFFILRPFYKLLKNMDFFPFVQSYYFFKIYKKSTFIKKYIGSSFSIKEMLASLNNVEAAKTGILKLDIEGSEYDILDDIVAHKEKFNAIIMEFHYIKDKLILLKEFTSNLNFKIVNVSVNEVGVDENSFPHILEITFLNPTYNFNSADFVGQNRNNIQGRDLFLLDFA